MVNSYKNRESYNFTPNSNVLDAVNGVIEECESSKRIKYIIHDDSPYNQLFTKLHINDLQSIITSIMINAIEAIDQAAIEHGEIETHIKRAYNSIVIKIRNNGKAIDSDEAAKIFDYNFSTKSHRAGLGLFRTVQILKFACGNIRLCHSESDYTEFEVVIPAV